MCISDHLHTDAIQHLPTSDDDKFIPSHFANLSTSFAALDLAPLSQNTRNREKSSEWPQFLPSRGVDNPRRQDRRITTPSLNLANFLLLTSPTRSQQRPLHSFLSTSKHSLTFGPPDLGAVHPPVPRTVPPTLTLRARSRQPEPCIFTHPSLSQLSGPE